MFVDFAFRDLSNGLDVDLAVLDVRNGSFGGEKGTVLVGTAVLSALLLDVLLLGELAAGSESLHLEVRFF